MAVSAISMGVEQGDRPQMLAGLVAVRFFYDSLGQSHSIIPLFYAFHGILCKFTKGDGFFGGTLFQPQFHHCTAEPRTAFERRRRTLLLDHRANSEAS
jgi:hypothetical protein